MIPIFAAGVNRPVAVLLRLRSVEGTTMTPEIVCAGEAIIDMLATERGCLETAATFTRAVGGSPANIAVGLARLGAASGFLGAVGDDPFGRFVTASLKAEGVGVEGIRVKVGKRTRLAFVAVDEGGERDFSFWETEPADEALERADVEWGLIAEAKILHLSSFLLLSPRQSGMLLWLARKARDYGTMVSFDPNLRMDLWRSADTARFLLRRAARLTTVFRGNLDEGRFITGLRSEEAVSQELLNLGPSLVVLTQGSAGCTFRTARVHGSVPGFAVEAVDTTGCGDGFLAGLLFGLLRSGKGVGDLTEEELAGMCRRANAVGALVAKRAGAAAAMPGLQEVEGFLEEGREVRRPY